MVERCTERAHVGWFFLHHFHFIFGTPSIGSHASLGPKTAETAFMYPTLILMRARHDHRSHITRTTVSSKCMRRGESEGDT